MKGGVQRRRGREAAVSIASSVVGRECHVRGCRVPRQSRRATFRRSPRGALADVVLLAIVFIRPTLVFDDESRPSFSLATKSGKKMPREVGRIGRLSAGRPVRAISSTKLAFAPPSLPSARWLKCRISFASRKGWVTRGKPDVTSSDGLVGLGSSAPPAGHYAALRHNDACFALLTLCSAALGLDPERSASWRSHCLEPKRLKTALSSTSFAGPGTCGWRAGSWG